MVGSGVSVLGGRPCLGCTGDLDHSLPELDQLDNPRIQRQQRGERHRNESTCCGAQTGGQSYDSTYMQHPGKIQGGHAWVRCVVLSPSQGGSPGPGLHYTYGNSRQLCIVQRGRGRVSGRSVRAPGVVLIPCWTGLTIHNTHRSPLVHT